MFYLERLSSTAILTGILPWEFQPAIPIPENVRKNKADRDAWINAPTTRHCVYTLYEALDPNQRITALRSDGEGNPPYRIHGLVADYDHPTPEEALIQSAKELPFSPNWIEKTLSGNWRFIWLFEKPILVPSFEFFVHFLKTFPRFGFNLALGAIGFDKPAWENPARYYTNSCDWRKLHPSPIPDSVVQGWLVQASSTFKWADRTVGAAIPLDVVKAELEKKYPRFVEWPGDFQLGAQGPSFWIPESKSPKSSIVRETGMQSFSAHATKAFYTWGDLLGAAFIREYQADYFGRAVRDIYTDGKKYYWKNPDERWVDNEKTDLFNYLKVDRKVSAKPDKTGESDIEKCLSYIRAYQRVSGAVPFVMRPSGIVELNGERYLNTLRNRVMRPADGEAVWGQKGQFPWVSFWLDGLYQPTVEQLQVFLSWLHIFYKAAFEQKPRKGHTLVIAGGVNVGKTLLNTRVIGAMVGGYADASDFLMESGSFNSNLLEVPYWTSDDSVSSSSRSAHRLFSEMVKKFTANQGFNHKKKYAVDCHTEWLGRIGISCNDDEESVRKIPDLEISILEKLIILRAAQKLHIKFPPSDELEAILARELPWFCRYILDYKVPAHLLGDSRFIIKSYCEPSLLKTSQQSSYAAGFAQILSDWKTEHFKLNPKADCWEGTAYQLQKQILIDPTSDAAMRRYDVDAIGRVLAQLKNQGVRIETHEDDHGNRLWRLFPDPKPNRQKSK